MKNLTIMNWKLPNEGLSLSKIKATQDSYITFLHKMQTDIIGLQNVSQHMFGQLNKQMRDQYHFQLNLLGSNLILVKKNLPFLYAKTYSFGIDETCEVIVTSIERQTQAILLTNLRGFSFTNSHYSKLNKMKSILQTYQDFSDKTYTDGQIMMSYDTSLSHKQIRNLANEYNLQCANKREKDNYEILFSKNWEQQSMTRYNLSPKNSCINKQHKPIEFVLQYTKK